MLQMKNILLVLAAISSSSSSSSVSALKVKEGGEGGLTVELMSKWKLWTDAHGKTYETHDKKMERLQVWLDNNGTLLAFVTVIVVSIRARASWQRLFLQKTERLFTERVASVVSVLT